MRSASVAPDLSSASSRVSDTVNTAIFSGTNGRFSSIPGISILKLAGREGVARLDRAFLESGREPAFALLGCAVGEAVGHHPALGLALQHVVADGGRRLQRGV